MNRYKLYEIKITGSGTLTQIRESLENIAEYIEFTTDTSTAVDPLLTVTIEELNN